MLSFILAVILGGAFAFVAIQNALPVPLHLGGYYLTSVPLYLVAFASFIAGIVISGLFGLVGWASSAIALVNRNSQLEKAQKVNANLQSQIQILQVENKTLKEDMRTGESKAQFQAEEAHQEADEANRPHEHLRLHGPSFLDRLRYRLAI